MSYSLYSYACVSIVRDAQGRVGLTCTYVVEQPAGNREDLTSATTAWADINYRVAIVIISWPQRSVSGVCTYIVECACFYRSFTIIQRHLSSFHAANRLCDARKFELAIVACGKTVHTIDPAFAGLSHLIDVCIIRVTNAVTIIVL